MQQLTLTQVQVISGGQTDASTVTTPSISNLLSATSAAFQNGLTPSELGAAVVGLGVGAGLAAIPGTSLKVSGLTVVAGYVLYSHFQPNLPTLSLASVTNWFSPANT